MSARCYFVPNAYPPQAVADISAGQYQWWNMRDSGHWVCDMWMNHVDGVIQRRQGSRESETSVHPAYLESVEARGAMVRVW